MANTPCPEVKIGNPDAPARFFLLDSACPASLTLRDYSKVTSRSNQRMRQKPPPVRSVGGSMLSLRARRIAFSLAVLLCLTASTLVSAQSTGGRILGRVADSTGAVLAGVKITATN